MVDELDGDELGGGEGQIREKLSVSVCCCCCLSSSSVCEETETTARVINVEGGTRVSPYFPLFHLLQL